MNIEAYDIESLRKLVRDLQAENRSLKELLAENQIAYETDDVFRPAAREPDEYDPDQASLIEPLHITDDVANHFFWMFWGRQDVYARRGKNGGYFPQCRNRWTDICPKQNGQNRLNCAACVHQSYDPLKIWHIKRHLLGLKEDCTDVIGIYPLFPDNTCRLLVFDFDNHEKGADQLDNANSDDSWRDEVDALQRICEINGVDALTERSRSGCGAHIWILFNQPVPAALARQFGFALLDKGCESINLTSFRFYDRMYPSQDSSGQLGNLVALPLQGRALKAGNSAFVDCSWNAYPNQLEVLWRTKRLSQKDIEGKLLQWNEERTRQTSAPSAYLLRKERLKPWKRDDAFHAEDVVGKFHIVLADGVYVDALNLTPRIQNQVRCMATIDNPEFYRRKNSGNSTYYCLSMIYLGKDVDGYIQVPRGLFERITEKCREAGIPYDVEDQRTTGRPIRVSFNGELRTQQDLAAEKLLRFENGVLSAATAFGKTVVCSYLVAQRKVSTLILLENTDLVDQWVDELNRFLVIDEEPPTYRTKTGRVKKRQSVIGTLRSGSDKTTGIVDVAMIGSVYHQGQILPELDRYGLVIMDECHHAASAQAQQVLQRIKAKYVYGVSATPMRSDKLEKINYMMLGPIRHQYTPKEHALAQGMGLYVRPRFTRVVNFSEEKLEIHRAYELISENDDRNEMIIQDVRDCIQKGRSPVVLTRLKKHAKHFYDKLQDAAQHVFLLYGDNTPAQNQEVRRAVLAVPRGESMLLIATGQKIGEGFDCPRLDTLMLASPVKFDGRLIQYVGRLNRSYVGKSDVVVYDYVDAHIGIFDHQYRSRLAAYKKIGYRIQSDAYAGHQIVNAIYDHGNYAEVFERDLVEAEKEIIIASPDLRRRKVERMMALLRPRQEAGVSVTVITLVPDCLWVGDPSDLYGLIEDMRRSGIHVVLTEAENEHYAVIDQKLVWHGGMNLLGKEDVWDNLIRVESVGAAAELLQMSRQNLPSQQE